MPKKPLNYVTEVYCTLTVEGVHCWANCPIEEVSYLRNIHRHMFGIKAYVTVNHDDRDVEFIWLKHQIQDYLVTKYFDTTLKLCNFGGMSCEMIGKELGDKFKLSRVEVNEDGENGAIVYFPEH